MASTQLRPRDEYQVFVRHLQAAAVDRDGGHEHLTGKLLDPPAPCA